MRLLPLLCILAAAAGSACGKQVAVGPKNPIRHVSGYALVTVFDSQGGPSLTDNALQITAFNPNSLLPGNASTALETVPLAASGCDLTAGCPYLFNTLDFSRLTFGLLVRVGPPNASNAQWVDAFTWVADSNSTRAALDGNYAVQNTKSYAWSVNALQGLQSITGLSSATLQARGVLVGMIQGTPGEAGSTALQPPPLAGAAVNTDSAAQVDIFYVNDSLDGVNPTDTTGRHGIFVAVPKQVGAVVDVWRVTAPVNDSVHHWPHSPVAGSFPGDVTLLALPSD